MALHWGGGGGIVVGSAVNTHTLLSSVHFFVTCGIEFLYLGPAERYGSWLPTQRPRGPLRLAEEDQQVPLDVTKKSGEREVSKSLLLPVPTPIAQHVEQLQAAAHTVEGEEEEVKQLVSFGD